MTTTILPAAASAQAAAEGYTARRRQITVFVVALAFVMDLMDATILTIALPTIQRHMHASLPAVNWMATAYPLAFAVLLITGGRLGDLLGYRRLFLAGVSMFLAASVLVGTAWSPDMLITARILQGAAAALMVPQVLSVVQLLPYILSAVPPGDAGAASGVANAVQQVGGTLGVAVLGAVFFNQLATVGNYGHAFAVVAALQVVLLVTCAALSLVLPRRIAADAYQPTL